MFTWEIKVEFAERHTMIAWFKNVCKKPLTGKSTLRCKPG